MEIKECLLKVQEHPRNNLPIYIKKIIISKILTKTKIIGIFLSWHLYFVSRFTMDPNWFNEWKTIWYYLELVLPEEKPLTIITLNSIIKICSKLFIFIKLVGLSHLRKCLNCPHQIKNKWETILFLWKNVSFLLLFQSCFNPTHWSI